RRSNAHSFMRECYRVLRTGGILRVGVPDLEQISNLYLKKLNATLSGDVQAAYDYEWMMLEVYDQTVREGSSGEMLSWLRQDPLPNEGFVYERIGEEGRDLVQTLKQSASAPPQQTRRRAIEMLSHSVRSFSASLRR